MIRRTMQWLWQAAVIASVLALAFVVRPEVVHAYGPYSINVSFQARSATCTKSLAQGANGVTSISADGAFALTNVCIYVENTSTGLPIDGAPVEVRVLVGTVGISGTARYSGYLFTSGGGIATISYRGDGKTFGGDTVVANYGTRAVATNTIQLTPAAGRTPAKLVALEPETHSIAVGGTAPDRRYISPTVGVNVAVQVQDARELGVNDQMLLVRVDGARVVSNPGMALTAATSCASAVSRTLVLTTATNALVTSGTAMPGTVNFAVCADPDQLGQDIIVTIDDASAPLPSSTISLQRADRPTVVSASFEAGVLTATVTDANDEGVVDGTPVRIVLPTLLGAVSSSCVATRDGRVSVVLALVAPSATVLVTAEYNEAGLVASCTTPGTHLIVTSVNISRAVGRS